MNDFTMDNQTKVQNEINIDTNRELLVPENWTMWMAYEVVTQWQKIKFLEIETNIPIVTKYEDYQSRFAEKLQNVIQDIVKSMQRDSIESVEMQIDNYFHKYMLKELIPFKKEIEECNLEYEDRFNLASSSSNPQSMNTHLRKLCKNLKSQKEFFKENIKKFKEKELASYRSYLKLKSDLSLIRKRSKEYQNKIKIVFQVLAKNYEFKLIESILDIAYQNILSSIQTYQKHCNCTFKSSKCLSHIRKSIQEKCSLEVISTPVFFEQKKINSEVEKKKMEEWAGNSIHYWGDISTSWQEIEQQLLNNMYDKSLEAFENFKRCFSEHLV